MLTELDLFVMRLKSSSILSTTKKKKKKKKKLLEKTRGEKGGLWPWGLVGDHPDASPPISAPPAPFPEEDYRDFFQKVKYAFNLMVGPVGLGETPQLVGTLSTSPPAPAGCGGQHGDGGGTAWGHPFTVPHRDRPISTRRSWTPSSCWASSSRSSPS